MVSRTSKLTQFPGPRDIITEFGEDSVGDGSGKRKYSTLSLSHVKLLNRIRLALGLSLIITPEVREEEGLPKVITDADRWAEAQAAQSNHVEAEFQEAMQELAEKGTHTPTLWTADMVSVLEEAYVEHVQPAMSQHFARARSPEWISAMHAYWDAVLSGFSTALTAREGSIKQLLEYLRTRVTKRADAARLAATQEGSDQAAVNPNPSDATAPSSTPDGDAEGDALDRERLEQEEYQMRLELEAQLASFRYAQHKLRLVALLREHGVKRNLPLPCPSYIADLQTTLEGFQHTFRWVSATGSIFESCFPKSHSSTSAGAHA